MGLGASLQWGVSRKGMRAEVTGAGPHLHALDTLVPSGDDHALAEGEGEGAAAVAAGVELDPVSVESLQPSARGVQGGTAACETRTRGGGRNYYPV